MIYGKLKELVKAPMRKRRIRRMLEKFESGEGHRYALGGCWGDRIEWRDFEKGGVTGWKQRIPEVGDWLLCEMKSGRTGLYRFAEVEPCGDPHDMFFAEMEAVDYVDVDPSEAATKSMFI